MVGYATITTDRNDYPPNTAVVVSGTGWQPGETVNLVFHETNGPDPDVTYQAVADSSGKIANSQFSTDIHDYGVIFTLTATGVSSGLTAQTSFSDGANLDGCSNGPATAPTACVWINGNLNSGKAHYNEGDSAPYRVVMDGLALGTHTVQFGWDVTDSGKHAIDYLTSFNRTLAYPSQADPCLGVTGCSGPPTLFPIPLDPSLAANGINTSVQPVAPGSFAMFGGAITSASAYGLTGAYAGSSATQNITLTFTATSSTVVLAWGDHLATRLNWGNLNTLLSVNGSSYHTHFVALDGGGGSQDKQIAADAVVFPGSITIVKHANPQSSEQFSFSASPAAGPVTSPFSLVDDGVTAGANTKVFANIVNFQTYSITENLSTAQTNNGWTLDLLTCTDTDAGVSVGTVTGTSASIPLSEGENVRCDYYNSKHPVLIVNKVVVPSSDTGLFNLQIDGTTAGTGANVANGGTTGPQVVSAGSHTVGETAGTGTSLSNYLTTIDCGSGPVSGTSLSTGNLAVNTTTTCTITNTRKSTLTVTKTLLPNTDTGTFNLQIDGATAGTGAAVGNNGTTGAVVVGAGVQHTVGETGANGTLLSNYTAVIGGACDSSGHVTLQPGDNKTCTITNTKNATLTVTKTLVPSTDTGTFNLQIDGATAGTGAAVGNNGTTGAVVVSIGVQHTVSETGANGTLLSNYTAVIGGACDSSGNVTLQPGDNKTCTITNTKNATLTVTKTLVPSADTGTFNLQIDGATAGTGAAVGNNGTTGAVAVSAGVQHTVGETGANGTLVSNYTAVFGGACDSSGHVTLQPGDTKTCTITNSKNATLTVNKVLNPSGDAGRFNLQIDGATKGTGGSVGNGGTTGAIVVTTGVAHTVGETAAVGNLSDYDTVISGDCAANGSVTLNPGDTKTCTITNTRHATLTVNKILNPSGDSGRFNLRIDGATAGTGASVGDGGTTGAIVVTTGVAHTVSETAAVGNLSDYVTVIGGDCASNGSITLNPGDNKTCTITNARKATLTVTKTLVPSADAGTFNLRIDGATATGSAVGNNGTTGAVVVSTGVQHTVSETGANGTLLSNYTAVIGGACDSNGNVTLQPGDNKTCTITNTKNATLTVTKTLLPSSDSGRFNLQIDGATAGTGAAVGNNGTTGAVAVSAGVQHAVGETGANGTVLSNYTAVFGGACDSSGHITLQPGDTKTCTITNTKNATLTVNKVLNPPGDPGLFNLLIDGATAGTGAAVGNGGTTGAVVVASGVTHTVSETAAVGDLATYITAIGGDCASNGTVTLSPGQNKVCTITNTRDPSLTVIKYVIPSDDPGKFNLLIDGVSRATDVGDGGNTGVVMLGLGSHKVTETAGFGTNLSDYLPVFGGACAADGSVLLGAGDNKVCTITNTLASKVQVIKTIAGGLLTAADSFTFQLRQGASTTAAGTILASGVVNLGNAGTITFPTKLDPNQTYQLCEVVMPGWKNNLPNLWPVFNSSTTSRMSRSRSVVGNARPSGSSPALSFSMYASHVSTF